MTVGDILHGLFRHKRLRAAESVSTAASRPEPVEAALEPNTGLSEASEFDPAVHTVAEVAAYVVEHPDERDRVVAAETAGKARKSILAL